MIDAEAETANPGPVGPDGVETGWAASHARLKAERGRIFAAIRDYPTPITTCDVQFNRLLEDRQAIVQELKRLEALRPGQS